MFTLPSTMNKSTLKEEHKFIVHKYMLKKIQQNTPMSKLNNL